MPKTIALVDGHPDRKRNHFVNALADAYQKGAERAGHKVIRIDLSALDFEVLRDPEVWKAGAPDALKPAQRAIAAADHLVFVYPLWMGGMPALLKAFLEQLTAGGFAVSAEGDGKSWTQKLKGKSARIVVTMGMPAFAYRYYFGAHGLKSFERNILSFAGVSPIRDTLIGLVDARSARSRERVLARMDRLAFAAR